MKKRIKCIKCGKHFDEIDVYELICDKKLEYWCMSCGEKKWGFAPYRQYDNNPIINVQDNIKNLVSPHPNNINQKSILKGVPKELHAQVMEIIEGRK